MRGDVHSAGEFGYPLAVAIVMLMVSAWKHAMGPAIYIYICVAYVDGAYGRNGHGSPERNPSRGMAALQGILSGPHADS